MLMSLLRVFHLQEEQLGDHDIGDMVVNRSADEMMRSLSNRE